MAVMTKVVVKIFRAYDLLSLKEQSVHNVLQSKLVHGVTVFVIIKDRSLFVVQLTVSVIVVDIDLAAVQQYISDMILEALAFSLLFWNPVPEILVVIAPKHIAASQCGAEQVHQIFVVDLGDYDFPRYLHFIFMILISYYIVTGTEILVIGSQQGTPADRSRPAEASSSPR